MKRSKPRHPEELSAINALLVIVGAAVLCGIIVVNGRRSQTTS